MSYNFFCFCITFCYIKLWITNRYIFKISQVYVIFAEHINYSLRAVVLFVPLAWVFSRWGHERFWMTFVVTGTITTAISFLFYGAFKKENHIVIGSEADSNNCSYLVFIDTLECRVLKI